MEVEWSEFAIHFYGPVDLASDTLVRGELEASLAELLAAIPLDAERTLGEAVAGSHSASNYFKTALMYPQVVSTRYSTSGEVQNEYAINLLGPFIEDLIPRPSASGRPVAPDTLNGAGQPPASIPSTGFVIDARGSGFKPAVFPRLLDPQGRVILDAGSADRGILLERGYVHYAYSPRDALQSRSLGLNPLRVIAERAAGRNRCDLVLSQADADRITGSALNRQLLTECRVIIIIDRE